MTLSYVKDREDCRQFLFVFVYGEAWAIDARFRVEGKMAKSSLTGKFQTTTSLRIFMGSSSEAAVHNGPLDRVAGWLSESNHKVKRWNDRDSFRLGCATWDELLGLTDKVDAAIFICSADDKTWIRGDKKFVTRDNVWLEYGLFCGAFHSPKLSDQSTTKRVVIVKEGKNVKMPTDLNVMFADLADLENCRHKIREWANGLAKELTHRDMHFEFLAETKLNIAKILKNSGINDRDVNSILKSDARSEHIDICELFERFDTKMKLDEGYQKAKREIIRRALLAKT